MTVSNKWTNEQNSAIIHKDSSLIVSAAAGSGKTAVLVERILRKISIDDDSKKACDINKLLVVTFTNAAAAEMRGKIAVAISKILAQDPENMRMRRQLSLMPSANIQTVHSFCLNLIRDNFHSIGLQPEFSILDESDEKTLKIECLEDVLEENYKRLDEQANGSENFKMAVEWFSNFKSDKHFQAVVLEIYTKLQSLAYPLKWLDTFQARMEQINCCDVGETVWGQYILQRVLESANKGLMFLNHGISEMEDCPEVCKAYQPAFNSDIICATTLIDMCQKGRWDDAFVSCDSYSPERLGSVRKFEDKEFLEGLKSDREVWKKCISDIKSKFLIAKSSQIICDIQSMSPVINGMFSVIRQFQSQYAKAKLDKNVVDFNDLEHMALSLLTDDDGKRTQLAQELSQVYNEIMVDEYQDTNEVQDAIFAAISKDQNNLFMVGDVKQSIYRFRLADPSIFLKKYLTYKDYTQAKQFEPTNISMSKNFRSRQQVIDAVNLIFRSIMSEKFGDLDYTEKEALHLGASYSDQYEPCYNTEIYFLQSGSNKEDESDEISETKAEFEADFIAHRIKKLLDDSDFKITDKDGTRRNAQAKDVAILLRSVSSKTIYYQQALAKVGISCVNDQKQDFFETYEIMSIMSILKIINNFTDDVYMISAMRSPAYGFTSEELANIRVAYPKLRFSEAVKNYAKTNQKCGEFLSEIFEMRKLAPDIGISRFVWDILTGKKLLSLFGSMENGEQRRSNLLAFYECTVQFENGANGDLDSFIYHLDQLQQAGSAPSSATSSEGNGVKIMSIHKSKGLEFPIVVVPDCAKTFNEDDTKKPVLFHSELGLGLKMRNIEKMTESQSMIRNAVSDKVRCEALSEELRILYVALTRAKEKLIISMALPNVSTQLEKWSKNINASGMSAEMFKSEHSMAMWIATPLLNSGNFECLKEYHNTTCINNEQYSGIDVKIMDRETVQQYEQETQNVATQEIAISQEQPNQNIGALEQADIIQRFNYKYPYKDSCIIPSKITATELNKANNLNSDGVYGGRSVQVKISLPDFVVDKPLSATEKGIANHLAMQYMKFECCLSDEGIKNELERLRNEHILSEKQCNAVKYDAIKSFFKSSLFDRIISSQNVKKEFKFSLFAPAKEYFTSLSTVDNILLQGVIDCMFEENGEIVIVDFKSDNVSEGKEQFEANKYKKQLEVYSYAMQRVTGKKIKECVIYFIKTGTFVSLAN